MRVEKIGVRGRKIKAVAEELTKEIGSFTLRDFSLVLSILKIDESKKLLDELLESNTIYEPKPGRYKTV